MSTHTTHFCDCCNGDREITHGDDDGHAINYSEIPTYDGWAEFEKSYIDRSGDKRTAEYHVCARCLADPDFDQSHYGAVAGWDTQSRENLEKGRKHADAFAWAQEHLGTPDRWGFPRGVRQVFDGSYAYGYRVGPKFADGRFSASDRVPEARAA